MKQALFPQRVRTRLTLLYAVLFLLAGASLLALTYALLASRLPASTHASGSITHAAASCKQLLAQSGKSSVAKAPNSKTPNFKAPNSRAPNPKAPPSKASNSLTAKCKAAFQAVARAASQNQRQRTLDSLLLASLIGLGITTILSAGLGWLLSGRALGPVRMITETARRASAAHLGERLALGGPNDELRELADTFDEMLERLDQAFASQKRFVANAAHELRTPLTVMRTSVDVTLSKPARTPEQLEAMAAKIRRSIDRAEATIDALLTLASTESRRAGAEPVDLATAAEDALDTVSPLIAEHGLCVDAALEPATASGDSVLLERMIANLVDNAVRHNEPHGWIRVQTGVRNAHAFFEIANSGPRVSEEMIPALFEPFGRAEQRLNSRDGVGLGLSIARAIGLAHGARLVAHSQPDGGLEISVTLPQASDANT
jgi:signal transduction histidine kinase